MTKKNQMLSIALMMGVATLTSCGWNIGKGDLRDCNIHKATLAHLDSISNVEYVGLADTRDLNDGRFQAVVIYYVTDSIGNKIERNARVTTDSNGSKIFSWEDLDCRVLDDTKQKVAEKLEEKGINIDGNLIDELIELKKRTQ